jgi:hypothetical protein
LQQGGGEGMAQGVGAAGLRQTDTANRHLDGFVDDTGGNVMAPGAARARVYGEMPGRTAILPAPFLRGV